MAVLHATWCASLMLWLVLHLLYRRVLTTTWVEGQTPAQILRSLQEPPSASSTGASTHSLHSTATVAQAAPPDAQPHQPQQQQAQSQQHQPQQQRAQQQQQLLQLVDLGIQASLHQLMVSGCLHADPHPGNLLLSGGNMLVYLDFGLLVRVPPEASMVSCCASGL
jgi:Ser/Thr protein kinase RdoA (MazF antagonist)